MITLYQYRHCLRCVDALMINDPEVGTPEGDALDALSKLCEQYEKEHFPIEQPSPESLAMFRKLERGL